jgi:predicted Zn-dependent peptidase
MSAVSNVALPSDVSRLDNGLEVVLHEDHRTPIVSVNVWYHVGSKDEAPGKSGFAHLFEHVMYQGSKHVPEDTYIRSLERAGAIDINGTTNIDRTMYYETVPANRLELALWLESDRMGFLLSHADAQTFAVQRDVVKNERRQNYENAPYGLVSQFVRAALYPPEHPYHHPTIGDPRDLDAATLDDVRAFFRAWYVPSNATLIVAGDIDKARTRAMIDKYFGPIAAGRAPARPAVPEVKPEGETRLDVNAGVELARTQLSWPTPAFFAPGDGDLDLVARILSSGKTSRLYKRLVYDLQIAQSVSASQASAQLGSLFEIVATAQPGHTGAELLRAIDEELAKLRSGAVNDAELARAKTITAAQRIFDLERGGTRAALLGSYGHYAHDFDFLGKDLARYEGATAASVQEAAARYLAPERRVVTLVTPTPNAPVSGALVRIARGGAK